MSLQIEQPPSFPVTGIDEAAIDLIRAEGGYVNRQPEFCLVGLPPGTQHKHEASEQRNDPLGRINRPKSAILYKLPSGRILKLHEHYLSLEDGTG
jgi:hypothetical protein